MKNVDKMELIYIFEELPDYDGSCNSLEYAELRFYGIKPMSIIQYLKSVNKYDDSHYVNMQEFVKPYMSAADIRANISDMELKNFSFTNMAEDFTDPLGWDEEIEGVGYELAADYFLSSFCTNEQFQAFMRKLVIENMEEMKKETGDDMELPMENPKIKEIMDKILS